MSRIQMEPTGHLVMVDGVECRIWNAVTEQGLHVFVFVHRIAVRNTEDLPAFGEEFDGLVAMPPPELRQMANQN